MGTIKNNYNKGDKVGEVTFIEECERIRGLRSAIFRCKCGKEYKTTIDSAKRLQSKSCGCYRKTNYFKHGHCTDGKPTPEYTSYMAAKTRCDENYKQSHLYYERGIYVCDRWKNSFENFLEDMGLQPSPQHSLDRLDNDGPYSPENCAWRTPKEQANNRRTNRWIEYNGKTQTLSQWAEELKIHCHTLQNRLNKIGMSIEEAFTTPVKQKHFITYKGKTQPLIDWCRELGLNPSTISYKLNTRKMTPSEAFEENNKKPEQ